MDKEETKEITLMELTKQLLDLRMEKKSYCQNMGERIKDVESAIKALVRDDDQLKLPL